MVLAIGCQVHDRAGWCQANRANYPDCALQTPKLGVDAAAQPTERTVDFTVLSAFYRCWIAGEVVLLFVKK